MKLWKGATLAFMLCGAALSAVLLRNMAALGQTRPNTKYPQTPSASYSKSTSRTLSNVSNSKSKAESSAMGGPRRRSRSTDDMGSLLSEFTRMFQSFTESELQHVVGALLDRKRRKSRLDQSRRTKRARRPKPCSVRELKLTVSELGLGYESNETMLLRYCSGKCTGHRSNYDITMEHMMRTGFKKKGRKDKVSNGPCCRPTAFEEDFSFLDDNYKYRTIQNLSAKNCGCV
ncbi:neurturin [Periophthalmus magnuspinnatus]|uniref:neurturin n=1 Tax=Periophthalmus magnuspinnatus TaxID=409849 RepID=UPI00145A5542|nr:neurturin [Periophthalmus magnuspinnatus]XP_055084610.1 neurturin [Periophthalmus magnuspinnatus]